MAWPLSLLETCREWWCVADGTRPSEKMCPLGPLRAPPSLLPRHATARSGVQMRLNLTDGLRLRFPVGRRGTGGVMPGGPEQKGACLCTGVTLPGAPGLFPWTSSPQIWTQPQEVSLHHLQLV